MAKKKDLIPIQEKDVAEAVGAYARHLCNVLGQRVGVFAASGVIAPRSTYQCARLCEYDPLRQHEWSIGRAEADSVADAYSRDEVETVDRWLSDPGQTSLLVLAPPGAGKSALLESIALRMATALLAPKKRPGATLPPVPLLLPLAQAQGKTLHALLSDAESLLTDKPASLRPEILQALRGGRQKSSRLILLLDGFDELDGEPSRRALEIAQLGCRFILASRPGHGAEDAVIDSTYHLTLKDMGVALQRQFVRAYFQAVNSKFLSIPRAIELFEAAHSGPMGPLFGRPLHLKAWCDCLRRDPARLPRTVSELADELLRALLGRRGLWADLSGSAREDAISGFARGLGRIGHHFVDTGVSPQRLDDAPSGLALRDSGGQALTDAAIRSGLLQRISGDYYLPKTPVVEYCIGRYLAEDAAQYPQSPKLLIETFRRWAWRPRLHDILDWTFDLLWREPETAAWANHLLNWLSETPRHESCRRGRLEPPAHDDLIRPFALLALRWRSRSTRPQAPVTFDETEIVSDAATALTSALASLTAGVSIIRSVDDILPIRALYASLLVMFLRALVRGESNEPDDGLRVQWRMAYYWFVERINPLVIPAVIEEWIGRWDESDQDEAVDAYHLAGTGPGRKVRPYGEPGADTRVMWGRAIGDISRRVDPADRDALLERWRLASKSASFNADQRRVWTVAALGLEDAADAESAIALADAGPLPRRPGRPTIARLDQSIARYELSSGDEQERWAQLIVELGRNVCEAEAPQFVVRLLSHSRYFDDCFANAACYAAARILGGDAARLIEDWINLYASLGRPDQLHDWNQAIEAASQRVPVPLATAAVLRWITLHAAAKDVQIKAHWDIAIRTAATAARGPDAIHVCRWLMAHGRMDRAVNVAAAGTDIAVLSADNGLPPEAWQTSPEHRRRGTFAGAIALQAAIDTPDDQEPDLALLYRFALRHPKFGDPPLVLDLAVAADSVRLAVLDTDRELAHPDALVLLLHLADVRRRAASPDQQWVVRKTLFAACSIKSKRGHDVFLLDTLSGRGFIDKQTIPNAGRKPPAVKVRINTAGERFLLKRRT
jgi:hypothetical protein